MNLHQLFLAWRARPGVFALVLAVTVITTAVVSLVLPKTYVATASLLMEGKDEQSLSKPNVMEPLLQQQQMAYMQTQVDILRSNRVGLKVVNDLDLTHNPKAREDFQKATGGRGSFEDWLVGRLLKWMKVDTSQSSVMQVSFQASDAHFAARAANAFAKAYLDTMLELRVVPMQRTAEWFDEQLKGLRTNLEQAQAKLTDYQRSKQIVATDERLDVDSARLSELSTQLAQAQTRTSEAVARDTLARSVLKGGAGGADKLPEVIADPLIQRGKAELLLAEAKLHQLSGDLGRNHPLYRQQQSEVASLRAQLNAEMAKIVAGLSNSAREAREHEAQLRQAIAEQRTRVLQTKAFRSELDVLSRNVDSAQRAYDAAMQRFVVSKVESGANRTNVSVLDPAIEPILPARPRIGLNIALSVVVGSMLGLAVVFLMERFDRRVRSRDDLIVGAEVPLLVQLNTWRPAEALIGQSRGHGWALPAPG